MSYYLTGVLDTIGIKDSDTQLQINGYLTIVQLISGVGICFFVDKFGRRPLFLTSCVGMLVSFIVETIGSARYAETENAGAGKAVIVFIFIYYIFYNLGFCGLLVSYSAEILPYRIRAKVIANPWSCFPSLCKNFASLQQPPPPSSVASNRVLIIRLCFTGSHRHVLLRRRCLVVQPICQPHRPR